MKQFKFFILELLAKILRSKELRVEKLYEVDNFESFLYLLLRRKKMLTFIQIGANDGKIADPIYNFVSRNHKHIKGIVVEPMSDVFKELVVNYKGYHEITPVNVAVHNTERKMNLWRIDPEKEYLLPTWAKGIASFDRNHLVKKNVGKYLITETVECVTLEELVDRYNYTHIDLLQIDAEGYDSEIILKINFKKIRPLIIHFEHGFCHEHMNEQTLMRVRKYLHDNGYEIAFSFYDATAYVPEFVIQAD